MKVDGEITYVSLEGGFWGIKTKDKNYLPIHMHEQLKSNGKQITCHIEMLDDFASMQNWGTLCRIISFTTHS